MTWACCFILQSSNPKYWSFILYIFAENETRWCDCSNGKCFTLKHQNQIIRISRFSDNFHHSCTLDKLQIDFDISDNWSEPIIYSSKDDWSSNLKTILEWSPFASKEDLLLQVQFMEIISSTSCTFWIFGQIKLCIECLPKPNIM